MFPNLWLQIGISYMYRLVSIEYNKKEGRIDLYDFIRGFAMLLVILQHSEISGQEYLLAFHMPLFFFLSGFVSGNRQKIKFIEYVKTRFKRLMIPYLVFGSLFIISYFILSMIIGKEYDIVNAFWGMLTGQYGFVSPFVSGIYWFLMTLFVAELLVFPFCKISDKFVSFRYFVTGGGILLFVILSYVTTHGYPMTLFTAEKSFMAAAFILMGRICKPLSSVLLKRINRPLYCIVAIFCCVIVYLSVMLNNQEVLMYLNQYGEYGYFFLGSVAGTIATILIAKLLIIELNENGLIYHFLMWAGYNSLVLFPVHVTLLLFLRLSGFYTFIGIDNFLLHFVIVMCFGIPLCNFISIYMPWMLGEKKRIK